MTEPTLNQEAKPVAFFDFDGTLTTGDTLMPFLKYVVGAPKYYAKLVLVSPVLMAYFVNLIPNNIAKQVILKQYLAGYNIDELFKLGKRFSEEVIPTMLRPEGISRLRWHQEQGHECVLVSASLDIYLNAWSQSMSFSDCFCTSLKCNDLLQVSGELNGENCYGKAKVNRVVAWQQAHKSSEMFAYGDTIGDVRMLDYVDKGFMLNKRTANFEEV